MKKMNSNRSFSGIAAMLVIAAAWMSPIGARAQVPANDLCSGAISLTNDLYYSENTASATDDTAPCMGTISKGVWFKFIPPLTGVTIVDTCLSGFDTKLQVFSGTCGALSCIVSNDNNGPTCTGTRASATFSCTAGATYYICAGGAGGASGILQVRAHAGPGNDLCSGAIALADNVYYLENTANAADDLVPCLTSIFKGVWFSFTPSVTGMGRVDTCGSDFDTRLVVLTACGASDYIACNDSNGPVCAGAQASAYFNCTAGTTCYICAGGSFIGTYGNLKIRAHVLHLPCKVSNPTPYNDATGQPLQLTLSWTGCGAGVSYNVYFPTTNHFMANTTSTNYNPGPLNPCTTYYWRIDATNADGVTPGDPWQFTTYTIKALKPVNPSPTNNATGVATNVTLSWANGGGASSYNVYFNGSLKVTQTDTNYYPGPLAPNTPYSWRIDAVACTPTTGDTWSFTTAPPPPSKPTNPNPGNGATGVSINPTLAWTNGGGATSYNVYFNGQSKGNQTSASYSPGTLSYNTPYNWRIDAVNAGGTTPGDTWSFTTVPAKATTPTPTDGATGVSITATLFWANGGGATSYDVYFPNNKYKGRQTGTSYYPGPLASGTPYSWRIDAVGAGGTNTGYTWSFTTAPPPCKATTPSPTDAATGVPINPTLSWVNCGEATSYNVYINGQSKGNQPGTSYHPGTLAYSSQYSWRIDAVNAGGTNTGPNWSFTTVAQPPALPSKPINPSPGNGATGVSINPTLAWTNGGGATSYNVYFNGQSKGNQTGASYNPGPLAYNTTNYWQIDAVNAGGTTTGDTWSFTTLPPILVASHQGSNIVLFWPTNAVGFTLEYATNLPPTSWTAATPAPVIANGQYAVTNTTSGRGKFYRLRNYTALPVLAAFIQSSNIVLCWPTNSAAFTLEYTTNLPPTSWTAATPAPVIVNGQYTVTNTTSGRGKFYRLRK